MKRHTVFILVWILLLLPATAFPRSCGAASCPLNTFRTLNGGWFCVGLSHEYIFQNQIYVGSSRSFVGAIPGHHDEVETLNEKNTLQFQLGVTDRLSMDLNVPFVHREHSHIQHEGINAAWESWDFSGLGDMVLNGHYLVIASDSSEFSPSVSILGGIKFATGITGIRNAEGEEAEVTIQPGDGAVDGIAGIQFDQNIATVPTLSGKYATLPLQLGLSYQFTGKGTDDYRYGNTFLANVGTAYQILDRANLLLQLNARVQDYADPGLTDEPRENTGGTWIFLSPGLGLQFSDALHGYAFVQIPVHEDVHGIQQTAGFNLLFNVTYSLDLVGGE
ncbi:MAG TPA: hypothetical protein VI215_06165 [Bacteroidota bacterium]|jgi:hypothetical protein